MGFPKFYTVDEVVEIARAPRSSVCHWIYTGKLRSSRVGKRRLIAERDLAVFMNVTELEPTGMSGKFEIPNSKRR